MLKDVNQRTVRWLGLAITASGIILASFALGTVVTSGAAEIAAAIPGVVAIYLAAIGISMASWKRVLLIRGARVIEMESILGFEKSRCFDAAAIAMMRVERRRPKCYQLAYRDPQGGRPWTFPGANRPEPLIEFLGNARGPAGVCD